LRGSALSAATVLGSLIAVIPVITGLWWLIRRLNSDYHAFMVNVTYQDETYLWAFTILALAIVSAGVVLARKKVRSEDMIGGVLFWWWILTILTGLTLPPASFLFMWPFGAALAVGAWMLLKPEAASRAWLGLIASLIVIVPTVLIVLPSSHLVAVITGRAEALTGIPLVAVPSIIAALMFALMIPFLGAIRAPTSWVVPVAAVLASFGLVVWANATSGFDEEHPKPNMVSYMLDANTGQASWLTTNDSVLGRGRAAQIDDWTSQFLGDEPMETQVLPWIALCEGGSPGYRATAPAIDLSPPLIQVLGTSRTANGRTVHLLVTSPRGALNATLDIKAPVEAASLAGEPIEIDKLVDTDERLRVVYYALPPEGIELDLTISSNDPFDVEIRDSSNGLPRIPAFELPQRSADMVPAVYDLTDTTNVTRTYTIGD
jgi:hypothetical protein